MKLVKINNKKKKKEKKKRKKENRRTEKSFNCLKTSLFRWKVFDFCPFGNMNPGIEISKSSLWYLLWLSLEPSTVFPLQGDKLQTKDSYWSKKKKKGKRKGKRKRGKGKGKGKGRGRGRGRGKGKSKKVKKKKESKKGKRKKEKGKKKKETRNENVWWKMEDMEENEMMGKMRKRDTKKKKKKKNLPLQIFFSLSRGCLTSFQDGGRGNLPKDQ